jgi:AbrB family looped-hinge helix DNA binding protein
MAFDKWLFPFYAPTMNMRVTLDKAGRVVIPKTLRDELQLEPGDTLALESHGDSVTLRPVRSASAPRKEHGIWVFRSSRKLSAAETDQALEELRHKRDRGLRDSPE